MSEKLSPTPPSELKNFFPTQVITPFAEMDNFLATDTQLIEAYTKARQVKLHEYVYRFRGMDAYILAIADPKRNITDAEMPLGDASYQVEDEEGVAVVRNSPVIFQIGFVCRTYGQYSELDDYLMRIDYGLSAYYIDPSGNYSRKKAEKIIKKDGGIHVKDQVIIDKNRNMHEVVAPMNQEKLRPVRFQMVDEDPGDFIPIVPEPIPGRALVFSR